jgi:20S proteasome alpha/beta subunit
MGASLFKGRRKADPKAMTTVIGLIYGKGVMLFADTTEVIEGDPRIIATKVDIATKLHFLSKSYAVGCAGSSSSQINAFVNHLQDYFSNDDKLSTAQELYGKLNTEVIPAFCANDRKITAQIYGRDEARPISLEALFAAKLQDKKYALYKITVNISGGSIDRDDVGVKQVNFGGVGTGGAVVEPLMSQSYIFVNRRNYNFENWSLKLSALFCSIMLAIARDTDARTGRRKNGLVVTDESRFIEWKEYLSTEYSLSILFLIQALEEMPNFFKEIPFERVLSIASRLIPELHLLSGSGKSD